MRKTWLTTAGVIITLSIVLVVVSLVSEGDNNETSISDPNTISGVGEVVGQINDEDSRDEIDEYHIHEIDEMAVIIALSDEDGANAALISTNTLQNGRYVGNKCSESNLSFEFINSSERLLSVVVESERGDVIYRMINLVPNRELSGTNLASNNKLPCTNIGESYRIVAGLHDRHAPENITVDFLTGQEFFDIREFNL
jgi:hypothetical protein